MHVSRKVCDDAIDAEFKKRFDLVQFIDRPDVHLDAVRMGVIDEFRGHQRIAAEHGRNL